MKALLSEQVKVFITDKITVIESANKKAFIKELKEFLNN